MLKGESPSIMDTPTHPRAERYLKAIIAIAAIVLVVLCVLLVREYRHVRRLNYLSQHGSLLQTLHAHGPIGANDATLIENWMTFDYINHLFALPPPYLAEKLTIVDPRYPRLTVAEYAESQHLPASAFLTQVQNAVHDSFTPAP